MFDGELRNTSVTKIEVHTKFKPQVYEAEEEDYRTDVMGFSQCYS